MEFENVIFELEKLKWRSIAEIVRKRFAIKWTSKVSTLKSKPHQLKSKRTWTKNIWTPNYKYWTSKVFFSIHRTLVPMSNLPSDLTKIIIYFVFNVNVLRHSGTPLLEFWNIKSIFGCSCHLVFWIPIDRRYFEFSFWTLHFRLALDYFNFPDGVMQMVCGFPQSKLNSLITNKGKELQLSSD